MANNNIFTILKINFDPLAFYQYKASVKKKPPYKEFQSRNQPLPQKDKDSVSSIPKSWRVVIGQHAIREALHVNSKSALPLMWLKQGWESSQELKELHNEYRHKIEKIEIKPPAVMDRFGSHQGAALFISRRPELDLAQLAEKPTAKIVLLDGIEDPHNLGAILRSSWLLQVDAVLIPEDRAVGLTPIVHKVACGGAEHVPVLSFVNFSNIIEQLKKFGFWVFGLSHEGNSLVFDLKIPEKVVWCVGAEDKGLRKTTERLCDELVKIPQISAAASYNASVATAMALSETFRQQISLKKSSN